MSRKQTHNGAPPSDIGNNICLNIFNEYSISSHPTGNATRHPSPKLLKGNLNKGRAAKSPLIKARREKEVSPISNLRVAGKERKAMSPRLESQNKKQKKLTKKCIERIKLDIANTSRLNTSDRKNELEERSESASRVNTTRNKMSPIRSSNEAKLKSKQALKQKLLKLNLKAERPNTASETYKLKTRFDKKKSPDKHCNKDEIVIQLKPRKLGIFQYKKRY